eukprot:Phypoly_transcript_03345.p1 GENE.Phypoly_transcript_03345~~Phypoly_transcript_03345.p1  ORF type:complete len:519 (+),score=59.20 Phypoly_transcript_03345:92-1648(+)
MENSNIDNTNINNYKINSNNFIYGTWSQESTNGDSPFARNGHKMVVHKDNLFVYGGNDQKEDQTGEIHMYTPATHTWRKLPEGPPRTLHSAVAYKNSMVVFGGTGKLEVKTLFRGSNFVPSLFSEVWSFKFEAQQWARCNATGSFPPARDGHTAVIHNDTMYIFGGSDNTVAFCDLYSFSLERGVWMRARSEGTIPSPRRMHSCVVWDDCLWIFGGYDGKTSFNEVYTYNIAAGTWTIPRTTGAAPLKRYGHTAVVYKDYMYIFGGYGAGTGYINDMYHFHFPTCAWTQVSEKSVLPPRRGHAAAVYQDSMFVFGGGLSSTTYSNEMWAYKFYEEKIEEGKDTLIEDLQKMFDNLDFYPDIVFKVGEKTIRAHKCILSARCPYFNSLFKSSFQEATSSEINITDIGEDVFTVLLQYLYGGKSYLITPEVSFELLTLSERYMLPHLKWVCENVILEGIAVENVVTLLVASGTYKCTRLYRACLDFIGIHHQQVVNTEEFKTLPHTTLLEVMAVISAAKK